jgi:tripartite-type tricarboxylate transporter receptor subunit TctC
MQLNARLRHQAERPTEGIMKMALSGFTLARCAVGGLQLLAALAVNAADRETYPSRPIRMLVPHPAGGGNDILARLLGQKMQAEWGTPVIVDNRAGGNTIIATEIIAKATPDGYTLILTSSTHSVIPGFYPKLPYDPIRDFDAVGLIATSSPILVVHPSVSATGVRELIVWAKSRQSPLNYGSSGVSGSGHLAMELFKSKTGLQLVHVPYKGMSPVINDLIAGNVSIMFGNLAPTLPHVKSGRLRALATAGAKRSQVIPDLPTVAESGLPGFEVSPYFGVLGPAGMSKSVVAKLNAEIGRVFELPDSKERLSALGFDATPETPERFMAMIKTDMNMWGELIRQNRITLE